MKTLLINEFTVLHHKQAGTVPLEEQSIYGEKNIKDDKACNDCMHFFSLSCEKQVFKLRTNKQITLINIENFFNSFKEKIKGQRCDFLLYDDSKIILMDLTCTMEEHLFPHLLNEKKRQGKRLSARYQIENTIKVLIEEPVIRNYIDRKGTKLGILAYRVKDEDLFQNVPKSIEKTMKVWLSMENIIETRKLSFPMQFGFTFEMVKYPNVYNW